MDLSIVIPVYNSEKILPELVRQINETIIQESGSISYEIILINDRSKDNSWVAILNLCRQQKNVKGINLRKNAGQHNAIMAGLRHAIGDIMVIMDDDLQHSPRYIKNLYEIILSGFDVCYTNYIQREHAEWKKLGSAFNNWVASILLKKPKHIYLSSFKAMNHSIVKEVLNYVGPYTYIDGLILMVTDNIGNIDIEHNKRYEGKGNYNLARSISLWLQMATNHSIVPLRAASFFGIMFSFSGFLLAIFFVIKKLTTDTLPTGWPSTIIAILILGGVQLLALGAIGEYLGRAYISLNNKPQYVIKETANFDETIQ